MFYVFQDEPISVRIEEIDASWLCFGYVNVTELDDVGRFFSLPKRALVMLKGDTSTLRTGSYYYDDCILVVLNIISLGGSRVDGDRCALIIKKNMALVVNLYDSDGSIRDNYLGALTRYDAEDMDVGRLVYSFLEQIIRGDVLFLQKNELYIENLEKRILQEKNQSSCNRLLLEQKQLLLHLHTYYDQLIEVADELGDRGYIVLGDEEREHLELFATKVERLRDSVRLHRDSVVHLRDAYQSSLDLRLNQTMKVFTVVTVIFSPLCFITGWLGMNFRNMPFLDNNYGESITLCTCLIVTAGLLAWFRHKGWI